MRDERYGAKLGRSRREELESRRRRPTTLNSNRDRSARHRRDRRDMSQITQGVHAKPTIQIEVDGIYGDRERLTTEHQLGSNIRSEKRKFL